MKQGFMVVRKIAAFVSIFAAASALSFAEGFSVSPGTLKPVADGKIGDGEYSSQVKVGQATIYSALDQDGILYFAVKSPSKGWLGLGLGSKRMNGAAIFMGYVKDGTPNFAVMMGQGHKVAPAANIKAVADAVALSADGTVIEFSVPIKYYLKSGANSIPMIVASSNSADFTSFHPFYASTDLAVKN